MISFSWAILIFTATAATAYQPPNNYIVGGQNASIEAYPSIVQLEGYLSFDDEWLGLGGATILTERWLVTAAHCLDAAPILGLEKMRVIAGTSIRGDGQFFQLKSYIVHPDYAIRSPFDADIGLVELLQPLTWSDAVQPAPINAFGNELPDDSAVQVVGWGDTVGETMGENYADILQEVTLYTVSNAECKKAYEDEDIVTENMLCAGSRGVGDVDACEGDSGGPMYFRNQNDIDILVGVVSFGPYPCANPLKPGGFTKVSAYTDWILRNAV